MAFGRLARDLEAGASRREHMLQAGIVRGRAVSEEWADRFNEGLANWGDQRSDWSSENWIEEAGGGLEEHEAGRLMLAAIKQLGGSAVLDMWDQLAAAAQQTGSPIERAMLFGLVAASDLKALGVEVGRLALPHWQSEESVRITPQAKVDSYRLDFLLERVGGRARIAVECDGHDYHERTKQQAQRDRARDRHLQVAGLGVFRFTGSEIWKDPMGCARDAIDGLLQREVDLREEGEGG